MRRVVIVIFEGAELLDAAGPYEVFSSAYEGDARLYDVQTASPDGQPIRTANGLRLMADIAFAQVGAPDVLLVPGGDGVYPMLHDEAMRGLILAQAARGQQLLSVCTGALLLASAGVLRALPATTYHTRFDRMLALDPTITPRPGERWVDNGLIITSAGVSAGIDASLHYLARVHGRPVADAAAQYMEYEHWQRL